MQIDLDALDRRGAYRALISLIVPRPIAWVSTLHASGKVNLAPFSFFNGVSSKPPVVSVAVGPRRNGPKDTRVNVERTGEFVVNMVTPDLADAMVRSSIEYPPEISELEEAGLTAAPSARVAVPGVAESPIRLECRKLQIVEIEGGTALILGRVVGVHVEDRLWADGAVDPSRIAFLGRLGDDFYTRVDTRFECRRPG